MLPLLLIAQLLGQAENGGPEAERSTAVFTAPPATLLGIGFAQLNNMKPYVFIPVGVNFTAGELEWSADAAWMSMDTGGPFCCKPTESIGLLGFKGGWLSFGPVFHTGSSPLGGFFVSPKLTLGAFFIGATRMMFDGAIGADVGYQFTVWRFFIAFIVGASVGLHWGDSDLWSGPMYDLGAIITGGPQLLPAVGLNLQQVRVGFVF